MMSRQAFGAALREHKKRHLSQEALAFEAGLDRTYISLLALGRSYQDLVIIFDKHRNISHRHLHSSNLPSMCQRSQTDNCILLSVTLQPDMPR